MAIDIRIIAGLGTKHLAAGAHVDQKISMLQMNNDTVFSALVTTEIDLGNNSSTTYQTVTDNALATQGLTGITVSKTMMIAAPKGTYFSGITIDSGDCIAVLSE